MNEKVYITEVSLDRVRDVLFETALSTDFTPGVRDDILVLVQDWLQAGGRPTEESVELEQPPAKAPSLSEPTVEPDQVVEVTPAQAEPISESQFESPPEQLSEQQIEPQPETQMELQPPMVLQAESPQEQQSLVEPPVEWESEPQSGQDAMQQSADQLAVGQENLQVDPGNNQASSTNT